MRRSLCIAALLTLLLAVAPAAHAASFGSRQLRLGSHGSDVVTLQKVLRKLGYKLTADGDFGPITDKAVKSYERKHHMKVDGVVGSSEAKQLRRDAAAADSTSPGTGGAAAPPSTGGGTPPPAEPPPAEQPPSDGPPADPPPAPDDHVFPVRGSFSYGGADARFGAPRGDHTHQGQDVLAAEGTTLVSVSAGTVYWRAYQAGGAGNYVVIDGDDGRYYVYMHLRDGALVHPGDRVQAGQTIGYVGHTGAAFGPHLHFEVWVDGPWQGGGHPIDPLPLLKAWQGSSASR